jgi:hypothetical protein
LLLSSRRNNAIQISTIPFSSGDAGLDELQGIDKRFLRQFGRVVLTHLSAFTTGCINTIAIYYIIALI